MRDNQVIVLIKDLRNSMVYLTWKGLQQLSGFSSGMPSSQSKLKAEIFER